jgi:hypothetical protein
MLLVAHERRGGRSQASLDDNAATTNLPGRQQWPVTSTDVDAEDFTK